MSWENGGGFSLHAAVRIEQDDREGLERLLRYCARPPFALERIEEVDAETIIYHLPHADDDGCSELRLTPFELIAKIAALVPPPRIHRHRYFGVLAPNAPLREQITSMITSTPATDTQSEALKPDSLPELSTDDSNDLNSNLTPSVNANTNSSHQRVNARSSYISWLTLLSRIYEIFPLICPFCGGSGTIRIIAFITDAPHVRRILQYIGEPTEPPRISPARGPPFWNDVHQDSSGDPIAQSAPEYPFDQTISW